MIAALVASAASFVGAPGLGLVALLLAPQPAVTRVVVRNEMIWRVPLAPRRAPALEWREHKGPRCVPASTIVGATLSGSSSIDFALRDRQRVRAVLDDDCPAIDFYGGFYFQPEDGMICARRDDVRSRIGGSCRIDRFRRLVARPASRGKD